MKIIYNDNIPSDTSSETIWLEAIPTEHAETAQRVCDKLNSRLGKYGDLHGPYYSIVADDYKLYRSRP